MAKPPPSGPEGDSGPDANTDSGTNDPDKLEVSEADRAKPSTKDAADRAAADGLASAGGKNGST